MYVSGLRVNIVLGDSQVKQVTETFVMISVGMAHSKREVEKL